MANSGKKRTRSIALLFLVAAGTAGVTKPAFGAHAVSFSSPESESILLEVFSSEGCSSCPPADGWVNGLSTEARLWKDLVPVVYHVDYWDTLGWRDPFGSKKYSVRQRMMASAGSGEVYTPGFFLNGREWRGWFDRRPLPAPSSKKIGRLTVTSPGDGSYTVTFDPLDTTTKIWTVHLAGLAFNLRSVVTSGENRGKTLAHDFVVLGVEEAPLSRVGGRYSSTLRITPDVASAPVTGIAAWVTGANGRPVQSAGGRLPPN